MGRHSCSYKQKLRKGLWSPEEDEKLYNHITRYGHGCWSSVPKQAGLQRCGKSCRLRWINYLRPDLKRGTFSQQEENLIIELHEALGNRWSQIAAQLPGRTDNEIKNLWNSCIKKKLRQRGIDPNTHKPLSETEAQELLQPDNTDKTLIPEPTRALKDPIVPTKELFLDHGRMGEPTGYFNLPQLTYSSDMNQSAPIWFNPNSKLLDMNLEFDSRNLKPMVGHGSDNSVMGFQYWEGGNSCNNSSSSGNSGNGIELQSNGNLFDNGMFQWPEMGIDKEVQINLQSEPEDLKWSEYLNGSVPISTALQNEGQAMYGGIKEESQFSVPGLSTWHQNQQQQQQQKHLHLHSSAFEQHM